MYDVFMAELRTRAEFLNSVRGENEDSVRMVRAANAIEELSEQLDEETEFATALNSYVPQWIPVLEKLPEIGENVLLYAYGRVHFGRLLFLENNLGHPTFLMEQSGLQHAPVLETTTKGRITHWMPLPKPPDHIREAKEMVEKESES